MVSKSNKIVESGKFLEQMTQVIAEIGWNHMGDDTLAKQMIQEAANSGASFAKFQTWRLSSESRRVG